MNGRRRGYGAGDGRSGTVGRGAGRTGPPKTGVVLSGGGAKGAYAVGVLRALVSGDAATIDRPVRPEIYSGTSVGAFNATIMAAFSNRSPRRALDRLERIWRRRISTDVGGCGNGVFRLRGLPVQEIDAGCLLRPWQSAADVAEDTAFLTWTGLQRMWRFARSDQPLPGRFLEAVDIEAFFDRRPLERLLRDTCDLAALARSRSRLSVMTSRWDNGRERVFERREIAERYGHAPIYASLAIPTIFPPVEIEGAPYVDGGLSSNTPLRPAIRDGAEVLHVIYLDPLLTNSDFPEEANTLDVIARTFAILSAHRMNTDIRTARHVNHGLQLLAEAGVEGVSDSQLLAALGTVRETLQRAGTLGRRRRLVIHRYRPSGDLGSGADLLNFSLRKVDQLIEWGYKDTVRHDCHRSGCLLAGRESADGASPRQDQRPNGGLRDGLGRLGFEALG